MTSPTISYEPPRFDWYQATVEMSGSDLVDLALTALGDEAPVFVKGQNGYARGWEIRRQGSRSALVLEGGQQEFPHIVGTGPDAVAVARLVRRFSASVVHRVARCDVAVDTDSPGAFTALCDGLRATVRGSGVRGLLMHNPDSSADGATYYVGAKTSEVQARLYEKGKQLPAAERPEWVRYELQLRPQKERKTWAASTSETDLLGAARWSRSFASEYLDTTASAPPTRSERVSDLEGALQTLTTQYGARLLELLEIHAGDVGAFGQDLITRIEERGRGVGPGAALRSSA